MKTIDKTVLAGYNAGIEKDRLRTGMGIIEFERTKEILVEKLPKAPAVIYDIGGGYGEYAWWLASLGYEVHLFDISYQEVITWTTDGFYRETKEKVEYRKSEGCSVVEMECSALAACAQFRNVVFGQILYTADTLCNLEKWDSRNWGKNSIECALKLCLDSVLKL